MSYMRALALLTLGSCWWGDEPPKPVPPREVKPPPPQRLTPEVVLSSVSTSYAPALRRCYQIALKRYPGLSGRIVLTFSIDPAGRVLDAHADGPPELALCITSRMATWAFPGAKDADGKPATASFAIPLQLQAE